MAPIRLRHPKGVSTLELDLDNQTVLELQQEIYKTTEILPSQQEIKVGYPPQPLYIVPELPISSLGLKRGDQLIVTIGAGTSTKPSTAATSLSSRKPISTLPVIPSKPVTAPVPKSATVVSKPVTTTPKSPESRRSPTRPQQPESTRSKGGSPSSTPADYVDTIGGSLVHRVVPDDNSCLFSSVAVVFEQDIATATRLRNVVADAIRNDTETYSEAFLGRPRDDYIQTILKPASWGGAIELSIFAQHYQTEISSIDVETGRVDRFGQDQYDNRCILLYSGIHYDAVSLGPTPDSPVEFHQTLFPVSSNAILKAAGDLAGKLRQKKAYTNTATFDLKCESIDRFAKQVCGKGLKGEKEARSHAEQTGHTSFGEY